MNFEEKKKIFNEIIEEVYNDNEIPSVSERAGSNNDYVRLTSRRDRDKRVRKELFHIKSRAFGSTR